MILFNVKLFMPMTMLMTIDSRPGSDQGHLPHHIPIHVQETSHAHQLGEGVGIPMLV